MFAVYLFDLLGSSSLAMPWWQLVLLGPTHNKKIHYRKKIDFKMYSTFKNMIMSCVFVRMYQLHILYMSVNTHNKQVTWGRGIVLCVALCVFWNQVCCSLALYEMEGSSMHPWLCIILYVSLNLFWTWELWKDPWWHVWWGKCVQDLGTCLLNRYPRRRG